MKIAITPHTFGRYSSKPLKMLDEAGIEYVSNTLGRRATEDETIELLDGCVGLISGNGPVTHKLFDACPNLKVISHCGATAENIDIAYANSKGVKVTIAPNGHAIAVAEMAVALMLSLLRNIPHMDHDLRHGQWKKRMGSLLQGKKVGIIGFGSTGQTLARLLVPFEAQIAYDDPFIEDPAYPKMNLDELVKWADILTLHCPRVKQGCLLNASRLARMHQGGIVLNLAKPGLVDENALNGLLVAGHIAGAALDVYDKEPYEGPLLERENTILTPHVAFNARESRIMMDCEASSNIIKELSQLTDTAPND